MAYSSSSASTPFEPIEVDTDMVEPYYYEPAPMEVYHHHHHPPHSGPPPSYSTAIRYVKWT